MRQHPAAAAADLPKPHLVKETAAAGAGPTAAARGAEAAAAPAGHLMQERAMDWTKWDEQVETGRPGVLSGVSKGGRED
nr:unnamed protein product [Digitaria exilis]